MRKEYSTVSAVTLYSMKNNDLKIKMNLTKKEIRQAIEKTDFGYRCIVCGVEFLHGKKDKTTRVKDKTGKETVLYSREYTKGHFIESIYIAINGHGTFRTETVKKIVNS